MRRRTPGLRGPAVQGIPDGKGRASTGGLLQSYVATFSTHDARTKRQPESRADLSVGSGRPDTLVNGKESFLDLRTDTRTLINNTHTPLIVMPDHLKENTTTVG